MYFEKSSTIKQKFITVFLVKIGRTYFIDLTHSTKLLRVLALDYIICISSKMDGQKHPGRFTTVFPPPLHGAPEPKSSL
jgi:hypothetical protein